MNRVVGNLLKKNPLNQRQALQTSFSLGLTQEGLNQNVGTKIVEEGNTSEPINDFSRVRKYPTREKGVSKFSKSPFMVREVEIVKTFSRMEEKLWDSIFPDEEAAVTKSG